MSSHMYFIYLCLYLKGTLALIKQEFSPFIKVLEKTNNCQERQLVLAMILVVSFETVFIYDKANIMSMDSEPRFLAQEKIQH